MKLAKIELAEFSAMARMFPSKVIVAGRTKTSDGVLIERIDMDELGHVWINRGRWMLPVTSLGYWVPEDAEAEWRARFGEHRGINASETCPQCGKICVSAAGLAAHMRSHKPGG